MRGTGITHRFYNSSSYRNAPPQSSSTAPAIRVGWLKIVMCAASSSISSLGPGVFFARDRGQRLGPELVLEAFPFVGTQALDGASAGMICPIHTSAPAYLSSFIGGVGPHRAFSPRVLVSAVKDAINKFQMK